MLEKKARQRGMGVWGKIPMPPNAAPSDADIKTMVDYMLSL